jgi:hypothetical protein
MAFVAQCTFCRIMLQGVPDHRLGSSAECPRCRNSFTLAPMLIPPTPTTAPDPKMVAGKEPAVALVEKPPAQAHSTPVKQESASVALAEASIEQDSPPVWAPLVEEVLAGQPTAAAPCPTPIPLPSLPNYPALASFLLGSFAFLSAAIFHMGVVTFALGLVGLLLGPVALLLAPMHRKGFILPGVGIAVSLVAMLVAAFLPHWLGLSPLWGLTKPAKGDAVISLSGEGGLRRVAEGEAPWANAKQDALVHGDIRLRVGSANVGTAPFDPVPGKQPPGDRCLVIALRVTNAGVARKIAFTGWGGATMQDKPVLRDNKGKTYAEKVFGPGWTVKGQVANAAIPPGKTLDTVLVFEAPPAGIEYLRLELPASALGADGWLRMEIPKQMIFR